MSVSRGTEIWRDNIVEEIEVRVSVVSIAVVKGKNSLMKNNISRNKNFMIMKIKKFVTFNSIGVANKGTLPSSGLKF